MKISFTFDDGHPDDFKLVKLFEKYSIPVMLFIPRYNNENIVMSNNDIKYIKSEIVEIGSHTYNHKRLNINNCNEIYFELNNGKKYLEDILSIPIDHFCFPAGEYNNMSMNMALNLFSTIRTAKTMCLTHKTPIIDTFFHFYDRKISSLLYNSIKNGSFNYGIMKSLYLNNSYFDFIKKYITYSFENNLKDEIIIWGHSWELSKFDLWQDLDDLLNYLYINHKTEVYKYSDIIEN